MPLIHNSLNDSAIFTTQTQFGTQPKWFRWKQRCLKYTSSFHHLSMNNSLVSQISFMTNKHHLCRCNSLELNWSVKRHFYETFINWGQKMVLSSLKSFGITLTTSLIPTISPWSVGVTSQGQQKGAQHKRKLYKTFIKGWLKYLEYNLVSSFQICMLE